MRRAVMVVGLGLVGTKTQIICCSFKSAYRPRIIATKNTRH